MPDSELKARAYRVFLNILKLNKIPFAAFHEELALSTPSVYMDDIFELLKKMGFKNEGTSNYTKGEVRFRGVNNISSNNYSMIFADLDFKLDLGKILSLTARKPDYENRN